MSRHEENQDEAEIAALRILFSVSAGNEDAMLLALSTFVGRCPTCTSDVVLLLVGMLKYSLDALDQHTGRSWEAILSKRLALLLDMAEAAG